MSQFAGYVIPGVVFLVFGLKWLVEVILEPSLDTERSGREMALESRRRSIRRKLFCCRLKGLPAEGIIKLSIAGTAMAGSILIAYPHNQLQKMSDVLYATIYVFFAISGLVDVLVFYSPDSMPLGIENFGLCLSFIIEGLVFHLNLFNESFMFQHTHILLISTIYATAFILLVEVIYPQSITKLARVFLTILHGSWYIQSGFILHNPFQGIPSIWMTADDYNNALRTISLKFAWHGAVIFVFLLILLAIFRRDPKSLDFSIGSNRAEKGIPISHSINSCNSCNNGVHPNL